MLHLIETDGAFARKLCTSSNATADANTTMMIGGRARATVDLSWPLFCVSIQFTREALQALRSGALNKYCNQKKAILPVLHELHKAQFLDFFR